MSITVSKNNDILINEIFSYQSELNAIRHYVPSANLMEIFIVRDLVKLLDAKSSADAVQIISKSSAYFKREIGYVEKLNPATIDENKLKQLIKNVSMAAIKQKQMSNDELLAQMKKYEEMVLKQSAEKDKLNLQVISLISIELATLSQALNNIKFTARTTKNKFKKALDLMMHDSDFKSLSRETQIKILHDFINSDVLDLEYFLKRQLINSQRRSI